MTSARARINGDRSNEAGFTLVEMLVSITLLSLLSLLVIGGLRLGLKAWEQGPARAEGVQEVIAAQTLLRQILENAYPFYQRSGQTAGRILFHGQAKSVTFLAPTPIALGSAGRSHFSLSFDRRNGRTDLIAVSKPELETAENNDDGVRMVLLTNVADGDFAFFGARRSNRMAMWHHEWSSELDMPRLVRLAVRFSKNDSRIWPELTVAPRISIDVGCVYDALTNNCRGR